jgi:hypothetical protein
MVAGPAAAVRRAAQSSWSYAVLRITGRTGQVRQRTVGAPYRRSADRRGPPRPVGPGRPVQRHEPVLWGGRPVPDQRDAGPLASPEEAAAYPYSDRERQFASERFAGQAVGSPKTVRAQLTSLLERTSADELMLTTMVYDIEDRIRSFELIADKVAPSLPPAR